MNSHVELRFEKQCIDLDNFIKENLYSNDKKRYGLFALRLKFET